MAGLFDFGGLELPGIGGLSMGQPAGMNVMPRRQQQGGLFGDPTGAMLLGSTLMAAGAPSLDPGNFGRTMAQLGPQMAQHQARQQALAQSQAQADALQQHRGALLSLQRQKLGQGKQETFGAPVEGVDAEGNRVFFRPGSRGTNQTVAGFAPEAEVTTPKYVSPEGKLGADLELARKQYGDDSPQFAAIQEALTDEEPPEGPKQSDISGMRKEFTKQSGDFIAMRDAYGKIQAAKPSAAGDVGLVFNIMKMFDPSSTVREGEQATARQATGVPARVMSVYNRLATGETLTPEQRADFKDTAGAMFDAQARSQKNLENTYSGLADRAGFNSSDVVLDYVGEYRTRATPEQETEAYIEGKSKPIAQMSQQELANLDASSLTPAQAREARQRLEQMLSRGQ